MQTLTKKIIREAWQMRFQALAIAMVLMGGVAIFVMSLTTLESLSTSRDRYYEQYNFANVFASLKRAPQTVAQQLAEIPGINQIETRVIAYVSVEVDGFTEPVSAHLLSLPNDSPGILNQIYLNHGRYIDSKTDNEVIISKEFGAAHNLEPGDSLSVTINGRRRSLSIVGTAQSPEYIYQIAPGALFPDFKRYGVMWMSRNALASAYNMEGAFNNVSLTLQGKVNTEEVIDQVDTILNDYGGIGAYHRKDQLSNRFLSEELSQLRTMATVFPVIFFGVSAFLINIVINRLISLQRQQIACLKAFGYSNFDIAIHYGKLIALIALLGLLGGVLLGAWMGNGISVIYQEFFSLPFLVYRLDAKTVYLAGIISLGVALLGAIVAVRRSVKLVPAEAMRPDLPITYSVSLSEKAGLYRLASPSSRMILRHIERRPLRSLLTIVGIAASCGTLMIGGFQSAAIDYMVDLQFSLEQREDLRANFNEPTARGALYSLEDIEGISYAEGFRTVPVELKYQHRSYRTSIQGIMPDGALLKLMDSKLNPIPIAEDGIVMTSYLADLLGLQIGDVLEVNVLEGKRLTVSTHLVATAKQYLGANAYMSMTSLNRLLKEPDVISGALLSINPSFRYSIYEELKQMPQVAGIVERDSAIKSFYETFAETMVIYTFFSTLLGGFIAFGVVYNCMRITFSERSRELASLRVLGLQRREIAYILLGELFLLTLIAIPVGLLFGYSLCIYMVSQFQTDLYRIPLLIDLNTYAFASSVILIASLLSGIIIWRNLNTLDIVSALKSKD